MKCLRGPTALFVAACVLSIPAAPPLHAASASFQPVPETIPVSEARKLNLTLDAVLLDGTGPDSTALIRDVAFGPTRSVLLDTRTNEVIVREHGAPLQPSIRYPVEAWQAAAVEISGDTIVVVGLDMDRAARGFKRTVEVIRLSDGSRLIRRVPSSREAVSDFSRTPTGWMLTTAHLAFSREVTGKPLGDTLVVGRLDIESGERSSRHVVVDEIRQMVDPSRSLETVNSVHTSLAVCGTGVLVLNDLPTYSIRVVPLDGGRAETVIEGDVSPEAFSVSDFERHLADEISRLEARGWPDDAEVLRKHGRDIGYEDRRPVLSGLACSGDGVVAARRSMSAAGSTSGFVRWDVIDGARAIGYFALPAEWRLLEFEWPFIAVSTQDGSIVRHRIQ